MSNGSSQPFWNRFGGWLRCEPDINNDGAPYRLSAGSRLRLRDEINTGSYYRELPVRRRAESIYLVKVFFSCFSMTDTLKKRTRAAADRVDAIMIVI